MVGVPFGFLSAEFVWDRLSDGLLLETESAFSSASFFFCEHSAEHFKVASWAHRVARRAGPNSRREWQSIPSWATSPSSSRMSPRTHSLNSPMRAPDCRGSRSQAPFSRAPEIIGLAFKLTV